jgi:hypothetical protein
MHTVSLLAYRLVPRGDLALLIVVLCALLFALALVAQALGMPVLQTPDGTELAPFRWHPVPDTIA